MIKGRGWGTKGRKMGPADWVSGRCIHTGKSAPDIRPKPNLCGRREIFRLCGSRRMGLTLPPTLAYGIFELFRYCRILVTAAAAQLHIGYADMSLRRNPAVSRCCLLLLLKVSAPDFLTAQVWPDFPV